LSPQRIVRAVDTRAGHFVVAILVLLSTVAVTFLLWRQQEQVECSAEYNERQARSQQARADAAERDRRAMEKMVTDLLEGPPGEGRRILEEYKRTLEETDKQRRDNPVPPPPADLCG
jgi:hypothetical protein